MKQMESRPRTHINLFHSPFRTLYDETGILPLVRRSLFFMLMGNIFGNICGIITTGSSALTGYAEALGANDFIFGVLTAVPYLGTVLQIPAAQYINRTGKRKKCMVLYGSISRFLWIIVGLVPFFVPMNPEWLRIWTVIFLVAVLSVAGSFINVSFTPWMAELIPIHMRGRWMSLRDLVVSGINAVMGLVIAYMLDHIGGMTRYAIVFTMAGVLGVMDVLCFTQVQDTCRPTPDLPRLSGTIKDVFQNKPFVRFMIFWTAWCFTNNIAGPYFMRYALTVQHLSFLAVTICGQIASAVSTMLVIPRWGRFVDHYGNKCTLAISCFVSALLPIIWLFAVPNSPIIFFLFNFIGGAIWCASNLANQTMMMYHSPSDKMPSYLAIYTCFTSIIGNCLGTLTGGALLEWLQGFIAARSWDLDYYKVIFVFSVFVRLLPVVLFLPGLANDTDATLKTVWRDFRSALHPASKR